MTYRSLFNCFLLFALIFTNSCTKDAAGTQSGKGGSLARYTVVGNYLYIVDYQTLDVYEISNPEKMEFKSSQQIGFDIETIYPYRDKLFIGSAIGLYVYSISNPENPTREGAITHVRSCDPVVANDQAAYVTLRNGVSCGGDQNLLNVYRVTTSLDPEWVNSIVLNSPYGLGLKDRALYVCDGGHGLIVFDISKVFEPKKIKELKNDIYYDVIPYGNTLICYVSRGVMFYDISDPLDPKFRGSVLN